MGPGGVTLNAVTVLKDINLAEGCNTTHRYLLQFPINCPSIFLSVERGVPLTLTVTFTAVLGHCFSLILVRSDHIKTIWVMMVFMAVLCQVILESQSTRRPISLPSSKSNSGLGYA